jgi:hypothetical protein
MGLRMVVTPSVVARRSPGKILGLRRQAPRTQIRRRDNRTIGANGGEVKLWKPMQHAEQVQFGFETLVLTQLGAIEPVFGIFPHWAGADVVLPGQ